MTNTSDLRRSKGSTLNSATPARRPGGTLSRVAHTVVKGLWITTALLWPVLRWVISIEVFLQMLRAMYYWNTPGMYAGWAFALHFAVLVGITIFVSIYKPNGL
jgi:hypothetical protein